MKKVVIVSAMRTPIGSFLGLLSNIEAPKLASIALKHAMNKINLDPKLIEEVFIGNVFSSGLGQAPARQAAIYSGIPNSVPCTTINKVCASGAKSVIIGVQSILSGDNDIVGVGGMENMSQVPFYLKKSRNRKKLGDQILIDGILLDGLTDVYHKKHMGVCVEECMHRYKISKKEQDEYAIKSYKYAKNAWSNGKFLEEVIPIYIDEKKSIILAEDEEYKNFNSKKFFSLPTIFKKNGTITAGNSSTLADGASALILMSEKKAKDLLIKPLAKIISYADFAHEPLLFATAPSQTMLLALKKAKMSINIIDYFEFNEAFAGVIIVNQKILNINPNLINIHGGAISLGHPLGNSGSRILVTLIHILKQYNAQFGALSICNGGGGATSLIIENLN